MKHAFLLLSLLILVGCNSNTAHHCPNHTVYNLDIEIYDQLHPSFSPINSNVFAVNKGKNRKQVHFRNDSLVTEKYQGRLFPKYYKHDTKDSMYIIPRHRKNVFIYDYAENIWHILKTKRITSVHITETQVLLFGPRVFYKLNKETLQTEKAKDCPTNPFYSPPSVSGDTLEFTNGWSYFISQDCWSEGKVKRSAVRLLYDKDGIRITEFKKRYTIKHDTITRTSLHKPQVIDKTVWYREKNFFVKADFAAGTSTRFNLKIPNFSKSKTFYKLHHGHIWIYNLDQIYLINMKSGKIYNANIPSDQLRGFAVKDCSVYVLENSHITISPIDIFIKNSIPFDQEKHLSERNSFARLRKDLTSYGKLTVQDIFCIKDSLEKAYETSSDPEIQYRLAKISTKLFKNMKASVQQMELCYRHNDLSITQRHKCIEQLILHYGSNQDYNALKDLKVDYDQYFPNQKDQRISAYSKSLQSIEKYFIVTDSLSLLTMPQDEYEYKSILAKEPLRYSVWNDSGGCAGYSHLGLSLPLEKWINTYPGSKYQSKACTKLGKLYLDYGDYDDEACKSTIKYLKKRCPNGQFNMEDICTALYSQ